MDFVILKVNGQDVSGASHEDAVRAFQSAREPILVEVMRRAGAHRTTANPEPAKNDANSNETDQNDDQGVWVTAATQTEPWSWSGSPDSPPPPLHDNDCRGNGCDNDCRGNGCDNGCDNDFNNGAELDMHIEEVTLHRCAPSDRLGLTLFYPDGDEDVEETDVLVQAVEQGGIAASDGRLQPGDQVLQIDGEEVFCKEQAERLLSDKIEVSLLICRPTDQDGDEDELILEPPLDPVLDHGVDDILEPVPEVVVEQEQLVPGTPEFPHLQPNSRCQSHDVAGYSHYFERRDTMRSGSSGSSSSSGLSGSSGNSSSPGHHQGDAEPSAGRKMALVRTHANKAEKQRAFPPERLEMRRRDVEDHIYETIPEVSESEESMYCRPYDASRDKSPHSVPPQGELPRSLRITNHCDGDASQKNNGGGGPHRKCDSKPPPVPRGVLQCTSNSSLRTIPQRNRASGEREGMIGERIRVSAERKAPRTRESSLQTSMDPELSNVFAYRHCRKCMRLPTPLQHSTKQKNLKNVINSVTSSEKNHNYVTFLPQGTLYTNAANLEETIHHQQQQLYQQLLRHSHGPPHQLPPTSRLTTPPPQQYSYVSSPGGGPRNHSLSPASGRGAGEEVQYQYKVKVRADGSRYIARRPVRKQMLKERAAQIAEERTGVTTDDDAISELKLGRYWPREEKRRQLEQAREKKLRLQQRLQQRMPPVPEHVTHHQRLNHHSAGREVTDSQKLAVQKRSSGSTRRRQPSGEYPKQGHQRPSGEPHKPDGHPSGEPHKPDRNPSGEPHKQDRHPSGEPRKLDSNPSGEPHKPDQNPSGEPHKPDRHPSGEPHKPDPNPSGELSQTSGHRAKKLTDLLLSVTTV